MEYGCVGGFVSDCDVFFQSPNYFKVGTSPAGAAAHPGEAGDKKKTVQATQQISHCKSGKFLKLQTCANIIKSITFLRV
jgi:hypothetical protein